MNESEVVKVTFGFGTFLVLNAILMCLIAIYRALDRIASGLEKPPQETP